MYPSCKQIKWDEQISLILNKIDHDHSQANQEGYIQFACSKSEWE